MTSIRVRVARESRPGRNIGRNTGKRLLSHAMRVSTHQISVSQPLMTVDEAASYLRVSRRQIYKLVRSGDLQAVRVGERLRFRPEEVEQYLELRREKVP
jgi:excisionase family DNA binding protein